MRLVPSMDVEVELLDYLKPPQSHRSKQGTDASDRRCPTSLAKSGAGNPSGAWQKYAYNRTYGIIRAKNGEGLPQGCSYDSYRFPQGAVDDTTTNLSGADYTTSDQAPASGATCQDSVGAGNGSQ